MSTILSNIAKMNHEEDEQYKMYRRFLEEAPNKPVTVRLLDIREEKLPAYFECPHRMGSNLCLRDALEGIWI